MSWPFLEHNSLLAFAHRGGNLAAENTLEAFSAAQNLGYRYIETDVRVSRDGVVVVFHDASLNRLMGRPEYIEDLTWGEIGELRLPGGERVARLDQALSDFPDLRFNIEPKSDRSVDPLVRLLAERSEVDRVCIGSFSNARVRRAQEALGAALCTSPGSSAIPGIFTKAFLSRLASSKYACIQVPMSFGPLKLSGRLVQRLQETGLQVHVWTLNREADIEAALGLGVNGIISDEIELLKALLVERDHWPREAD